MSVAASHVYALVMMCILLPDLQFLCQMTQYWIVGGDLYKGRPNTERWVAACREYLAPRFDSLYQPVYDLAKAGTFTAEQHGLYKLSFI